MEKAEECRIFKPKRHACSETGCFRVETASAGDPEEKVEACGGVAMKSSVVRSLCAQRTSGGREGSVTWWLEGSSGWNCTQEHEPVSTHTCCHLTHTHTHTFRVLPHSWTHNLVPRWFMWVHVSMFSHIFHSQRVCVLTPFCILQWLHKFTSRGYKWDPNILSLTSHTMVHWANTALILFDYIKLP